MRDILIEIGFDQKSGNLAPILTDEHNEPVLKDTKLKIFPLQHGFVRFEGSEALPMWPTQLHRDDEIRFRIFDITRDRLKQDSRETEPLLFHAYFQNPSFPDSERQIFSNASVPIRAGRGAWATRLLPVVDEMCPSHVFGYPEKQKSIQRLFRAWDVVGPKGNVFRLKGTSKEMELERALMALALRVKSGEQIQDFFLDPELYVGPYNDDPGGIRNA